MGISNSWCIITKYQHISQVEELRCGSYSELECEIDTGLLVLLNAHTGGKKTHTANFFNQSFSTSTVGNTIQVLDCSKPKLSMLIELGFLN